MNSLLTCKNFVSTTGQHFQQFGLWKQPWARRIVSLMLVIYYKRCSLFRLIHLTTFIRKKIVHIFLISEWTIWFISFTFIIIFYWSKKYWIKINFWNCIEYWLLTNIFYAVSYYTLLWFSSINSCLPLFLHSICFY